MSQRERLPDERVALTHKFRIRAREGDVKGYLTLGHYPDGRLGEIFVKMDQQGSQVSGFVDSWAISVSMLLQMGMPLEEIVRKFRGVRFEPAGFTDNPHIRSAKSPVDYIARYLEGKYLDPELFDDNSDDSDDDGGSAAEEKTCDKCGSTNDVYLRSGRFLCKTCWSPKAA